LEAPKQPTALQQQQQQRLGLAAASLTDPACQAGTAEFAAAKAANLALLDKYNKIEGQLRRKQVGSAVLSHFLFQLSPLILQPWLSYVMTIKSITRLRGSCTGSWWA
jgi:hypothetical protein